MALLFRGVNTENQRCGGTLVGDRYVITAAHCTNYMESSDIIVLIGDTTLGVANDSRRFKKRVSDIRRHRNYDIRTSKNDIAVLVLSSPVDLKAHPNIKPACLPFTETKSDMYGRSAVVSGWGHDVDGGIMSSHLNEVTVKILSDCGLTPPCNILKKDNFSNFFDLFVCI